MISNCLAASRNTSGAGLWFLISSAVTSTVAVDITAEVKQAPLLSRVTPYDIIPDEGVGVFEKYLSGEAKPVKDWHGAGYIPCITGFEAEELVGEEYNPVREGMIALRDARKVLDDKIRELRQYCLRTNLVSENPGRQF
ncbi:MAG: hypothetical protein QMD97_00545 [Candidatus Aenigmarchaeota archaeon]|nr:hypothetical protein [Candidatus Aenigmarchaeota archaeon]